MSGPDVPLSQDEISQIVGWSRQAGQIALQHFNQVKPQSKSDHTFLTQADLEIERFLTEQIKKTFPTYNVIGEEGLGDRADQSAPYIWAIDPIDGTTAFVQGLPGWGISIGLLAEGQPCFGLFYMPLLDDLTYTAGEGKLFCNDRLLQQSVRRGWGGKGFLAVNATAHRDFRINTQRIRALGSIGASLVYTARGTAAGAFVPKARLWDLVAGAAIVNRAGGELRYRSGRAIDYQALLAGQLAPEPIIAAHPELQTQLRELIEPHQGR
jgi:myo-inositol-1(or 4)-monophosphatase